MYKFNLRSVDGNSVEQTKDLAEFSKDWLDGSYLSMGREGSHVTPDGITVITPADDITLHAVRNRAVAEELENSINISSESVYSSTMPLDRSELFQLIASTKLPNNDGKSFHIDSEQGRTFALSVEHPTASRFTPSENMLEDMGLGKGAFYLEDTLVVEDKLTNTLFITDLRKEAEHIDDMTARRMEKGLVIEASIARFEGFNDDGVFADMRVSGEPSVTKEILTSLNEKASTREESFFVNQKGYANTPTNPLSQEALVTMSYDKDTILMTSKDKDKRDIGVFTIDRKMVNAAGSTEKGFWAIVEGDKPTYLSEGEQLCFTRNMRGEPVVKAANNLDMEDYEKCTKTPAQRALDDPLGLGM